MTTTPSLSTNLQTVQNADSYLNNAGKFLFRNNVPEYGVTNFAPGSLAFKESLTKTFLDNKSAFDPGANLGLEPDPTYVSSALRTYANNIANLTYNYERNPLNSTVEMCSLGHYSIKESFALAEFTKSEMGTLANVSLSKIISVIVKTLTAAEKYPVTVTTRFRGYRPGDHAFEKGIFRRLLNVYEAIPGDLYCLSVLSYLGSEPLSGNIRHYWFNKHVIDTGVKTRELCPVYIGGGLPYFAGNMMWKQLGLKIHPLGYLTLTLSIEGSTFEVKHPMLSFDLMGASGFQYISAVHTSTNYSNLFRPNNLKTLDYSCFGLSYEADMLTYRGVGACPENFPNLLKICYSGFGRHANGKKRETATKLQSNLYSSLLNRGSDGLVQQLRKISSDAKRKAILEDNLQTEVELKKVPASKISSAQQSQVISRAAFYDKLVFAQG